MQRLNLQEDTKKQIQQIYKTLSFHGLQQFNPKVECYNLEYNGLGDRILSAYYTCNDKRLNELCDIATGISIVDTVGKVCTEIHRPAIMAVECRAYNTGKTQRKGGYRHGKRKDGGIIPEISSKHSTETHTPCEKNHNVGGKKTPTGGKMTKDG